jgi:hypothetical protein
VKQNFPVIAVTVLMFVPGISGYNLSKGHPQRGFWKTLFGTFLGNLLLALLPIVASAFLAPGLVPTVALASLGIFFVGLLVGLFRRRKRYETYAVLAHNADFLEQIGLRETGLEEVTHYAPDGSAMRLLEVSKQYAAFMLVGARGKRAYIKFDDTGRMIEYTGVGAIGQMTRQSSDLEDNPNTVADGIDFDELDTEQLLQLERAVKRAKSRKRNRA